MHANWIKIVLFVLAAFMLAGVAQVFLDPGLGQPNESRRTRHPAGFSAIPPNGWGGSVFYALSPTSEDYLRVSPERSTGRQPSMFFSRWHEGQKPAREADAVDYTFQDKPATLVTRLTKYYWVWRVDFERDGIWYRVGIEYPIRTDVEKGPLWPFLQSFKVEKPFHPTTISTTLSSTSAPATAPATEPATR